MKDKTFFAVFWFPFSIGLYTFIYLVTKNSGLAFLAGLLILLTGFLERRINIVFKK